MVNHSKDFNKKKYEDILCLIKNSDKSHVEISNIINIINKFSSFHKFILQIKEENDKDIFNKFITICNIDYKLFNSIIEVINNNKYNYKEDYCVE